MHLYYLLFSPHYATCLAVYLSIKIESNLQYNAMEKLYTILEFQGPTGLEILAPAGGFLASLAHILYHYLDHKKMFVLPPV